jgi:Fe-S-cluster containining protein
LVDNKCSIYEDRPEVCNVRTMWEKTYRAEVSWEDYCAVSEKICGIFKGMIEERDRGN